MKNYLPKDNSSSNYLYENNEEEIVLGKFLNFLNRKKKQILSATIGATTLLILFTYTQKNIWQGNFRILVESSQKKTSSFDNGINDLASITGLYSGDNAFKDTQSVILSSPYILSDIYTQFKKKKLEEGFKVPTFEEWVKKNISVKFENKSNVLNVKLKDENKELIIETLNYIAKKFQDYSIADKKRKTSQGISFLLKQKELLNKNSLESLTKLNKFSIANGLGDFDGFVGIEGNKTEELLKFFNDQNNKVENSQLSNTGAGKRFSKQFNLLESYEALFIDLSAKLKPNSITLKNLKLKIDNLRKALKRPNEILLEYRNLKRIAEKDINILTRVESELSFLKFENAKKEEPWLILSDPIIEKNRVYPIRSQAAITAFLISFIISTFFIYKKERKGEMIYEFDDFLNIFPYKFLEKLSYKNKKLNSIIIKNEIRNSKKDLSLEKNNFGYIYTSFKIDIKNQAINFLEDELPIKKLNLNINDSSTIEKCDGIFIFAEIGAVSKNELFILNKCLDEYNEKIIGWFLIDKDSIFT